MHGGFVPTKFITGRGGDGLIRQALVGVDSNANRQLELKEVRTLTDENGYFAFEIQESNLNPIIMSGGFDTSLGVPFTGHFIASMPSSTTTQMITPLTTLLALGADKFTLATLLALPLELDWNQLDPALDFHFFRAGVQIKTMTTQLKIITGAPRFLVYKAVASIQNISVASLQDMASSLASGDIAREDAVLMHESFRAISQAETRESVIALEMLALDSLLPN